MFAVLKKDFKQILVEVEEQEKILAGVEKLQTLEEAEKDEKRTFPSLLCNIKMLAISGWTLTKTVRRKQGR